jgi:hypothetical protein
VADGLADDAGSQFDDVGRSRQIGGGKGAHAGDVTRE